MRRILILVTIALFYTPNVNGQNFFFLGENSYPSTKTFSLQPNSDDGFANELNVLFAKDGTKKLFVVKTKTASTLRISEKLIIYLDDGTVISCIDKGINDNVDDIASSIYYLTDEDLIKMKRSNINTIRYIIKCSECYSSPLEGKFSASNKGSYRTDYPSIITTFFSE